jgi:hypothetical protein
VRALLRVVWGIGVALLTALLAIVDLLRNGSVTELTGVAAVAGLIGLVIATVNAWSQLPGRGDDAGADGGTES